MIESDEEKFNETVKRIQETPPQPHRIDKPKESQVKRRREATRRQVEHAGRAAPLDQADHYAGDRLGTSGLLRESKISCGGDFP